MSIVARVPSLNKRKIGLRYNIEQLGALIGCECPSFGFSGARRTCKHLRLYLFAVDRVAHCTHVGGAAVICLQCFVDVLAAVARKRSIKRETKKRRQRYADKA